MEQDFRFVMCGGASIVEYNLCGVRKYEDGHRKCNTGIGEISLLSGHNGIPYGNRFKRTLSVP